MRITCLVPKHNMQINICTVEMPHVDFLILHMYDSLIQIYNMMLPGGIMFHLT